MACRVAMLWLCNGQSPTLLASHSDNTAADGCGRPSHPLPPGPVPLPPLNGPSTVTAPPICRCAPELSPYCHRECRPLFLSHASPATEPSRAAAVSRFGWAPLMFRSTCVARLSNFATTPGGCGRPEMSEGTTPAGTPARCRSYVER